MNQTEDKQTMADDYAMMSQSSLLNAPRKVKNFYYIRENGLDNDNEFYDTSNFESHLDSVI